MKERLQTARERLKSKITLKSDLQFRKKIALLFLTATMLLMTFGFYGHIAEGVHQLLTLKEQLDLQKQLIAIKETDLEKMPANAEELARSSQVTQQKISPYDQLADVLAHVSRMMKSCDISEKEFVLLEKEIMDSAPWNASGQLIRVRVKTAGVGKYSNVKRYINMLINDKYYYHLDKITINSQNAASAEQVYFVMDWSVFTHKTIDGEATRQLPETAYDLDGLNPFYYDEALLEK